MLNIVGLALDDTEVKTDFERWATQTNGSYHNAADGSSLQSSLLAATARTFKLYNDQGAEIAKARIGGEPISLTPGRYRVRFDDDIEAEVTIRPSSNTELRVQD